jgi:hypothetical protein
VEKYLLRVIGTEDYSIGVGGVAGNRKQAKRYTEEEVDSMIRRNANSNNGKAKVEKILVEN